MTGCNWLVVWLSGVCDQTVSVANWKYATFVRRLGEAPAPAGHSPGEFAIAIYVHEIRPKSKVRLRISIAQVKTPEYSI